MAVTIATHNGSSVSREHNIRNRRVTNPQEHINPHGHYEIWRDEKARDAYRRVFGEALEKYNARHTRDDRKIKDYFTHIEKDDKKHSVYEMIIGIYGKDENGQPICPTNTGKEIMRKFVDSWSSRNPNLEMIGAYYHADEPGEPHVHIDYIPVAHGYTRGLETQNGLVKALGEMGFEKKGRATAQIQWEARENKFLDALCRQRGLEVIHPEVGKSVEHLHTETYKAQQDRVTAILEAEQASADRLEALRKLDEAKAGRDVQKEIKLATERYINEAYNPENLIVKRSPVRKTLMGRLEPATVTLREDDFYELAAVHEAAQGAYQAAQSMEESEQRMVKIAKEMNRNRIDSHEISVDQRVQDAEKRMSELAERANKEVRRAKALEQNTRRQLQEVEQDRDHLRDELAKVRNVMAFFPEEWERMEHKTERARKLEELYYAYRNGEDHPDLSRNPWNNSCCFDIDHNGRRMDLRQLLIEYKNECDKQDIPHDKEIYERAEQIEEKYSYQNYEWER